MGIILNQRKIHSHNNLDFHNNRLLEWSNTKPLTATDHWPCQRRAVRFPCTPPIRRTGSIPSCVCASPGRPRGPDQSVGTSPDPQSWASAPSSSSSFSPSRQTGAPEEPGLCICLSGTNPSFGLPSKNALKQEEEQNSKKKNEMSKPLGFYPHSLDSLFHRKATTVRLWKEHMDWRWVKLCILLGCFSSFKKNGVIPATLEPGRRQ